MINILSAIDWKEYSQNLDVFFNENLTIHPMKQRAEAEVIGISTPNESFVLKSWNKASKPNISFQYHLLGALSKYHLPVPKPIAWGMNRMVIKYY